MFIYYLKSAIRSLLVNKKFTIINILGFSFALSVSLAISIFLIHEFSYDRYHKNADQIVRIIDTKNNSSEIDYRVKDIILENFPEFKDACLVFKNPWPTNLTINNKAVSSNEIMSVDNHFFRFFSLKFIEGNPSQPFANQNSVILTKSTAQKLFGNTKVIGKEILFERKNLLRINGIVEDFPENSSIKAGIFVNAENDDFKFAFTCTNSDDVSTHRHPFRIYALLNEHSDPENVKNKLNADINILAPYLEEVDFLPLKDIYLHDNTIGSNTEKGNPQLLTLSTIIAGIILILAIVNYINLTLAQFNEKNKIIGIRKSYGASTKNLLFHYFIEAIIMAFISYLLSIFIVWICSPLYSSVFNYQFSIDLILDLKIQFYLLASILFLGFLSGLGPSIALAKANPSSNFRKEKNISISRNILVVFQFAVSIALIVSVLVIKTQISFVKHRDPGFNKSQLLLVNMPYLSKGSKTKAITYANELRKLPLFENVSLTNGVPGKVNFTMGSGIENDDNNISVPTLIVDTNFLSTFQIKIINGRKPLPSDFGKVCLINEAFYKHFKFNSLDNKRFDNYIDGGLKIIAVVNDFQYGSLHNRIAPTCIILGENSNYYQLNLRIATNSIQPAIKRVKEKWNEILSDYPLSYQFYDDWFDTMYEKEERLANTILLFTLIAIGISCFGILGLAIFSAERRTKEIGVRKTNGAKNYEIISMLTKDFLKRVVIAFVIACPIAWYAMNKWLENFAYRTELSWWIFALAGVIAMGVALFTVSFQSWRAATRNPVESLRYE
ncbi:ABC transporter permease [Ancylomarina longa]|uniref:ABC transporter permease n=1 Tax=Ancylomarina longa TaxID=2487017 RepID=A0A434AGI5_9BACT|nr:ABC transporter permease [Ancylomarina longa]RUT73486.1 ABC transporter permease [Ancylomarina longa]